MLDILLPRYKRQSRKDVYLYDGLKFVFCSPMTHVFGIEVITLNSEENFPGGSWLGDSQNPHQRVR
jgi:hypothetical protein